MPYIVMYTACLKKKIRLHYLDTYKINTFLDFLLNGD